MLPSRAIFGESKRHPDPLHGVVVGSAGDENPARAIGRADEVADRPVVLAHAQMTHPDRHELGAIGDDKAIPGCGGLKLIGAA